MVLSACGGSSDSDSPSPSTSPSPSPSAIPALAVGTYVATAPITRQEAVAGGLEGADVDENLGLFTFELENGTFTLSQDPPKPVEFPVIIGPYESKGDLLVLTPTTFRDQVWTLRPHQKGTR